MSVSSWVFGYRRGKLTWLKLLNLLFLNLCFLALPLGSSVDILATDDPDFALEDQQDTQIYEKHDKLLHGSKKKK